MGAHTSYRRPLGRNPVVDELARLHDRDILDCPCTVTEVAEWAPQDISVISRHLKQLKDAGVVESSKQGRENYYRVNASRLAQTLRSLADALENCECCQSEKGGDCCE